MPWYTTADARRDAEKQAAAKKRERKYPDRRRIDMTNIEKIRTGLHPYPDEHERQAALAALAELEKAATQFVAGEVADEMCDRAYISKWRGVPELIGHEPDDEDRQWAREWLEAWRAELGPTLGMVELKEPTPEECERICTEYERLLMREGTCGGRDAFDAVRAVMWPKSEGS